MKKTKILTIALMLATLAGCGKDKGGNIHILAERMSSNSKVLVDPTNIPGGAEWVEGEYVNLNGQAKQVLKDNDNPDAYYYLENTENMTGSKLAFYPGQDINGKCDIELEGNTMLINSLSVVFDGTGKHHMAFPMVAIADDGENQLLFRHLTGGFLVTLKNTTENPVSVASLKIIAQSESEAQPLGHETYTAKWAVQGPAVPTGNVGGNGDSYNANYCSEMNFNLKSGGNTYATIGGNGELQFCIPITISKVDKLVVIGYDHNGNQLFKKQKAYTNTQTVVRNHMYDIPPIEF